MKVKAKTEEIEKIEEVEKVKNNKERKNKKRKYTKKENVKFFFQIVLVIILTLILLAIIFIYLFFKTSLFQKYKELWVQTAMTTMNHQYLATWFLSDEEIKEIMDKLKVENNENSEAEDIVIEPPKSEEVTVEKITGKGYVGYVMLAPDASKVKLVDGRKSR